MDRELHLRDAGDALVLTPARCDPIAHLYQVALAAEIHGVYGQLSAGPASAAQAKSLPANLRGRWGGAFIRLRASCGSLARRVRRRLLRFRGLRPRTRLR